LKAERVTLASRNCLAMSGKVINLTPTARQEVTAVLWVGDLPVLEFAKLYDLAGEDLEGLLISVDKVCSDSSFTSLGVFQKRVMMAIESARQSNAQVVTSVRLRYKPYG
jgi:hypothetical protein